MPSVSWISPPAPRPMFSQPLENRPGQQVAADDREVGRRFRRLRLLDDAPHAREVAVGLVGRDDAVAAGFAARDLLHADQAAAGLQVTVAHLCEHRLPRRRSGRPPGARRTVRCRRPDARTAPRGRARAAPAGGCRCRWHRRAGCRAARPATSFLPCDSSAASSSGSESK